MAGKFIACQDCEISITPGTGLTPGTPTYVKIPATAAKVGGSEMLVKTISWLVTGCKKGAYVGGGGGSMSATAQRVTCDGLVVMREDDNGNCTGLLVLGQSSTACACTYKITRAKAVSIPDNRYVMAE